MISIPHTMSITYHLVFPHKTIENLRITIFSRAVFKSIQIPSMEWQVKWWCLSLTCAFTHLLWVDTLLLSWMNLWICLLIFNFLIPLLPQWSNETVHKITLYFFPYVRLPHLSCIVLSCPVLSWLVLFF